ncbi:beta-xylosidase [Amylocarpus encephaloides]|uniref:Beta-xylosidase n=1 Tax=Amylocarpus encephaloides TaxID=45428 RepID=A0A9P7YFA8_9HELO|nr:beta-xylosidase [Amylocarpus encephaloides]
MLFTYLTLFLTLALRVWAHNATYQNPILPGFHPDPSCIFVPEWNNTYFCASSSFLVFPGIPIHASNDLRRFKLISNALNRPEQLPGLNTTKRATSGIWASTIRYHEGTFYVVTTHVYDDYPKNATNRFDNLIFTTKDPFDENAWSDPVHFGFQGYDTSPFWDDDGTVYITGTFAWEVKPGIQMFSINLTTGAMGPVRNIWNGTGGSAPEGPHIYKKDGWYYLMIAEGGTGSGHMVTIARAKSIHGPYESCPYNPVLTNGGSDYYFQNLGHADLFQDKNKNWWAVALSVRQGPDGSYPMGRETVMTPVTWAEGRWPVFEKVTGKMNGWHLDSGPAVQGGEGSLVDSNFESTFSPGYVLGPGFAHWRFPVVGNYAVSPKGHENSLQLKSSLANLTGHDGRSAEPKGQTFISRRQTHSLFEFSATLNVSELQKEDQEVGVSVFLDQLHHYDLGIVLSTQPATATKRARLVPQFRVRGITTVPAFISPTIAQIPMPETWTGKSLSFGINAKNITHYEMQVAPVGRKKDRIVVGYGNGLGLTWGFTGALLGVYATTNGGEGEFSTYVSDWEYVGKQQVNSLSSLMDRFGYFNP